MAIRFTFRQLEYFVAVDEFGSIAAASERINVSPPSISTAISQLEAEFGVELFVRQHAQGLSLTPGGRRFYSAAKSVLESAGGLHDIANDISEQVRGPITIGCLETVAPFVLPELRKGFQEDNPEADIRQEEAHPADLIRMLRRADIDAAATFYWGLSWGAEMSPIMLAVEPRLRGAVLMDGGALLVPVLPAADESIFAPRVTVPVLMINGRYDIIFPVESAQEPFLNLLGTPASEKDHLVYETGHVAVATLFVEVMDDVVDWLDRTMGSVR